MNRIKAYFIIFVLIFGLFSCKNNEESSPIQAVVLSNGDKINVVSPVDGKVLASSPLKMKFATFVKDGHFFAQNNKGYYDLYTLDGDKIKKTGETYSYVSDYYDGVSVVCPINGTVKLINGSGETVKDLSTIDDAKIKYISEFQYGYATFVTQNSTSGIIDTKGNVIIPATSNSGECKIVRLNEDLYIISGDEKALEVKDLKNNTVNELKNNEKMHYSPISTPGGFSPYVLKTNESGDKSIVDCLGNEITKVNSDVNYIEYIGKDYYVSNEGEDYNYSVCNLQGGAISSAKYTTVHPINTEDNTVFIVQEKDDKSYKLIDHAGNKINKGEITSENATYLGNNLLLVMNENPLEGGTVININDGKNVGNMPGKFKPTPLEGYQYVYNEKYTFLETIAERIGISFIDGSIDDIYEDVDPNDLHSKIKGTIYPLLVASNIKKKGYEPQIEWNTDGGMDVSYERDWRGFFTEYMNMCNYNYIEAEEIPVLNKDLEATAYAHIDLKKSSVKISGKEVLKALKKFIKDNINVEVKVDYPNYFIAVIKSYSGEGRSIYIEAYSSMLDYWYIPTEKVDLYIAGVTCTDLG